MSERPATEGSEPEQPAAGALEPETPEIGDEARSAEPASDAGSTPTRPPVWDSPSVRRMRRDKQRRKLVYLVLLLLLAALLGWVAWYVTANKRLPLPSTTDVRAEMEPPQYLFSITGQNKNALNRPTGVAIGKDGRVYVSDYFTRDIKVFTSDGAYLFNITAVKDGKETRLNTPVHLAFDADGNLWATDRMLGGLYVFTPEGRFVREVVPQGEKQWGPLAIAIDKGALYVSDVGATLKHMIRVLGPDGTQKVKFGQTSQVRSARDAQASFYFPNGLAVRSLEGSGTEIYVADGDNRRIQVFDGSGVFKRVIVTQGVPRGLAIDPLTPAGTVLLASDALAHQVDIYSFDGEHLTSFGTNGVLDGQFNYPNDIALDSQGRIYVADRANRRVQVWGWPKAEIPGITKLPAGVPPWVCAIPFLLLPIPFLWRRRRFMVTADFVDGMISAGYVPDMARGRFRWVIVDLEYDRFADRVVDGVNLGELLHAEPYSYSDASDLSERLQIEIDRAGILAMGQRYKNLCTEDEELSRLASALDVPVYDRVAWLEKFANKTVGEQAGDEGSGVE